MILFISEVPEFGDDFWDNLPGGRILTGLWNDDDCDKNVFWWSSFFKENMKILDYPVNIYLNRCQYKSYAYLSWSLYSIISHQLWGQKGYWLLRGIIPVSSTMSSSIIVETQQILEI